MPLDRAAFVTELRALADRFNRNVSDELARRYYQDLQQLTTDAFLTAARIIYRQDTFWPAPARFLEAAGVDAKSAAESAWNLTWREVQAGTGKPLREYDPAHAAALRAVGKNMAIARATTDEKLAFIKRDFITTFTRHRERGALPQLDVPEPLEIAGLF